MKKRIDDQLFIYFVFSVVLACLLFFSLGNRLDLSEITSFCLVLIAGAFTYLSIEMVKLRDLREEYLRELKDLENVAFDFLEKALIFFDNRLKVDNFLSSVELPRSKMELNYIYNKFIYKCEILRNFAGNGNDVDVCYNSYISPDTEKTMREIIGEANVIVDEMLAGNKLEKRNEAIFSRKIENTLHSMVESFAKPKVGFESFSERYKDKKDLCLSVVFFAVSFVMLKIFIG